MKIATLREGTVFVVPTAEGKSALGLIARKAPARGKVWGIYCYFFGPLESVPELRNVRRLLVRENAKVILKCGALNLHDGRWPVLGTVEHWNRSEWPLLEFVRFDELKRRYYAIKYDEDNIFGVVTERPTEVPEGLLDDVLYGADAAEEFLNKVMSSPANLH